MFYIQLDFGVSFFGLCTKTGRVLNWVQCRLHRHHLRKVSEPFRGQASDAMKFLLKILAIHLDPKPYRNPQVVQHPRFCIVPMQSTIRSPCPFNDVGNIGCSSRPPSEYEGSCCNRPKAIFYSLTGDYSKP